MQQHKIDPTQWALPEAETLAVVPVKFRGGGGISSRCLGAGSTDWLAHVTSPLTELRSTCFISIGGRAIGPSCWPTVC